jgi:hypothetical protein
MMNGTRSSAFLEKLKRYGESFQGNVPNEKKTDAFGFQEETKKELPLTRMSPAACCMSSMASKVAERSRQARQRYTLEGTLPSPPGVKFSVAGTRGCLTVLSLLPKIIPVPAFRSLSRFKPGSGIPFMLYFLALLLGGLVVVGQIIRAYKICIQMP